ncbi:MAG: tRNA 2-thiouridine(34) synthase MnmA [Demequinaceae bacterium]|nr:tRNA 2-thiouridine(34) synthase MnmA [Demequinaceae bacterium]
MRILATLSGGVDSAVAAARVVEAGHEVTGIHLDLGLARIAGSDDQGAGRDVDDARRVADALGIPFEVWDLSEEFERTIVAGFLAGYQEGVTPNPCVVCNRRIKFEAVLTRGGYRGFGAVSTGHYARLEPRGERQGFRVELHRAADLAKDQSYVLAALGREWLARAVFPLAEASKGEVRAEAAARGLRVHERRDSLDVCFIPDGDTAGFLRRTLGENPGEIVDEDGRVVGEHRGAYAFTVGQRKGLRLPRPAADGEPRYVLEVHPESNTVVVGPEALLFVSTLHGAGVVWLADDVPAGEPTPCHVQVRAHGTPEPAHVTVVGDRMLVELERPMRKVAQGQALVVYAGTRVLGQATASRAPIG